MKTLYFECNMGAAGDMLTASLIDLFEDKESIISELNNLGIDSVEYILEDSFKKGIKGSHFRVLVDGHEEKVHDHDQTHYHEKHEHEHSHNHEHNHEHHHTHCHCNTQDDEHNHNHDDNHIHHHNHEHEHHHSHDHGHSHEHNHSHNGMKEITEIINNINIDEKIKKDAIDVYNLIAVAESISHNIDVKLIHFHEVGNIDAIADIVAFCYLINKINPEKIVTSPINLGSGSVKCAHGILPVPAPATAYILKDVPVYSSNIRSELCTPTGAALLKHFTDEFSSLPIMKIEEIGYGMGKKDFEICNCVRSFIGTTENQKNDMYELSTNIDDMTGEELAYAINKLFEIGALDAFTTSVGMKKSRMGYLLNVLAREDNKEQIIEAIFNYTTTIGIREKKVNKYFLNRNIEEINTSFGKVRIKKSSGYNTNRYKYEYDDLEKIASEKKISIRDLVNKINKEQK